MNKDLHNHIATCMMREPADFTADATTNLVDLAGFESVDVLVTVGALTGVDGSNYLTVTLEECDTTVGTSFTTVASTDLIGAFTVIDSTSEDSVQQRVGYIGGKRYLRVKLDETGTISAGIIGVTALLGNARHQVASTKTPTSAT